MDEDKPTHTLPKPVVNASVTFDPSRMIGIIKRKALIKDLASVYHAECLNSCQELLALQRKWDELCEERRLVEDSRKETTRPPKRSKKNRH
ncbi:hypothetical protein QJS10_CPB17g02516 [Acorus calamus]|uniref:Uncharacterized protein n=1 Tax=Acorus calamus TaxID=4465 RepID=A0AAV9CS20_ACOCL|nr:hypothetical protein QJS10_CPB17g02516 [Acorus calamus]